MQRSALGSLWLWTERMTSSRGGLVGDGLSERDSSLWAVSGTQTPNAGDGSNGML